MVAIGIISMDIIKLQSKRDEDKDSQSNKKLTLSQLEDNKDMYSDSFKKLMKNVLNRIYTKNNVFRTKQRPIAMSQGLKRRRQSMDFESSQIDNAEAVFSDKNILIKQYATNRLGQGQNIFQTFSPSKSNQNMCIHNKTSVSFLNNKIYRKNLEKKKFRSLSSEIKAQKSPTPPKKQNFMQTRYTKRPSSKIVVGHSLQQVMKPISSQLYDESQYYGHRHFYPKGKSLFGDVPLSNLKKQAADKKLISRQKLNLKCEKKLKSQRVIQNQLQPWNIKLNQFEGSGLDDDFQEFSC